MTAIWKFSGINDHYTCFLTMDDIDESSDEEDMLLTDGKPKSWPARPKLVPLLEKRKKNQKPLADINYVTPGSVVLNQKAYNALKAFLQPFGEFLEVDCFNTKLDGDFTSSEPHYFYNVTNIISCIDYENSGKMGGGVSEPVFFPDAIPKDVQVFKDPHWVRTDILLSDSAKERLGKLIADAHLSGADIVLAAAP